MRVFVKSFGCSSNLADGEVLAGCLADAGYKLTGSISEADVVVYNTCAVKAPTENRMIEALRRVTAGKKVIVAGCLPLINFERLQREVRFDGVVGPAAGKKIVEAVERVLRGEKGVVLIDASEAMPALDLPRVKSSNVISILPINYGCLGACTYCCVVFARGRLRSYPVDELVARVRRDVAAGMKEFWVTSQDAACYGRDVGANLAALLKALCEVDGDFRVRVGMMTPNMVTDILSELIEAFKNPKVFKFVHLPVQSGDDDVLRRMRRFYTAKDFKEIVAAFRAAIPEINLATDVICGFPGETREAFENTLKLIEAVKPDIVNVSKFFPRPQTAAAAMQDAFVDAAEVKRRSAEAAKLAKRVALERNKRWIGWTGEVLVDERGKIPGSWIGRNFAYKPVVIKSPENLLGKTLRVRVVKAFSTYLMGKLE
ncbi:MAG: tRNA (N(6)-L-threonylcarbamoyladenosine(37)-C(2))-methylthiotransferase [Candidatus Bathyarchaeota archaeon]|nr:tRNA (N(6)-L-threonylcarbamoyladenosine(37)-C(2))-methylthiotransferase [Candidatus Bathyarchaeota archaeon]